MRGDMFMEDKPDLCADSAYRWLSRMYGFYFLVYVTDANSAHLRIKSYASICKPFSLVLLICLKILVLCHKIRQILIEVLWTYDGLLLNIVRKFDISFSDIFHEEVSYTFTIQFFKDLSSSRYVGIHPE